MTTVPTDSPPGLDRVPPHDLSAEQSVLGGMLLSKDAIADVVDMLKGHEFYRPAHETIYRAIIDLYAKGEPADPITLAAELTKRAELTKTGGASYLHTLVSAVPTAANAGYYAEIVRDTSALRRLVEAGTRITQMGYAGEGEAADVQARAQAELYAATDTDQADSDLTEADALTELTFDALDVMSRHGDAINGVPTGFRDLDQLTRGLQPGQMIVIGARPAVGKSTLAMDVFRSATIHHGLSALFFSLEMGREELGMRMLSAESRVALHHMRAGTLNDKDWTRLARRASDVSSGRYAIDDSPNQAMAQIRSKALKRAQTHGLDLVIVDYLQLMQGATGGRPESRQQIVAELSSSMKLLAKELRVPVVVLSQLNREVEHRTDKKPQLSDLRESGAVEQDADVVILLHREDVYEKEGSRAGEADLIVAKHRNGPTATITVAFQGHYSRFVDMAEADGLSVLKPLTYTYTPREPSLSARVGLPAPKTGESAGAWPAGAQATTQPIQEGI